MIDNLESAWPGPADGPATAARFVRWLETGGGAAKRYSRPRCSAT